MWGTLIGKQNIRSKAVEIGQGKVNCKDKK